MLNDAIAKIQDLSEEYRKKVELFNLLEELYKSIANLKPMKFKMDDCVSVFEEVEISFYRCLEPLTYTLKVKK